MALQATEDLKENYHGKVLVEYLQGKLNQKVKDFGFDQLKRFGAGQHQDKVFWESVYRNAILEGFIYKDVETYGIIKLTQKGKDFITNPTPFHIPLNRDYGDLPDDEPAAKTHGP